jgi:CheY-like chemotaxis protein
MDMQMPILDGVAATKGYPAACPEGRHTPIIAMTANAFVEDRKTCLDAGMNDFLSKPFVPKRLYRDFPEVDAGAGRHRLTDSSTQA